MEENFKHKKIFNVALASFGMSGKVFHAPLISSHHGFNLYAVWERTKNVANQFYPEVISYKNFEDILLDKNIDVVIINTPSVTHLDFATQALLTNKHVIVEKPFTATASEATLLITLAEKNELLLSVFQNRRWDSDFITVKKVIESDLLGEIKEAEIHFDRFTPTLSGKPHKEAQTPGVGILYDLGSHIIDQALVLFGMPDALFADLFRMRPNSLLDDYFEIIMYYKNFRVRLKGTFYAKEPQGYIVHGSKGSIIKNRGDVQEIQLQAMMKITNVDYGIESLEDMAILHYEQNGETIKENILSEKGNYIEFYDGIYESLLNKTSVVVKPQDAKNVIQIIELAIKSNEEKKVIYL